MTPLLSILIPTLDCAPRRRFLSRLMDRLTSQLGDRAVVLTEPDDGESAIGEKRNRLVARVQTPFHAFVDDDDLVPENYVERICAVLGPDIDAVGFRCRCLVDDQWDAIATHSSRPRPDLTDRKFRGYRRHHKRINHLNPIRTEIGRAVPFKPINAGEDCDYSLRLEAMFPSLREIFIDEFLYDYLLRRNRAGETTNATRVMT